MFDEAEDLPRVTASMIDEPTAYCARCGTAIFHRPLYVSRRTGKGEGIAREMETIVCCKACAAAISREEQYADNREYAARLDAAAAQISEHLAAVETIVRSQLTPWSVNLATGAAEDWNALGHGLIMCLYLAKRFDAAATVEADIAAGGTGAGDAPRHKGATV